MFKTLYEVTESGEREIGLLLKETAKFYTFKRQCRAPEWTPTGWFVTKLAKRPTLIVRA